MNQSEAGSELWTSVPVQAPDVRTLTVGLLALDIDDAVESDLRSHLFGHAIDISTARIVRAQRPGESDRNVEEAIVIALEGLLPTSDMDAIVFGCTTAAFSLGPGRVAELAALVRPAVPVIDPATACLQALSSIGARSIGLITPYGTQLSEFVARAFEASGLEVAARVRFELPQNRRHVQPTLEDYRLACSHVLSQAPVDCLLISCMGLKTAGVIAALQEEFDRPVFTSNSVVADQLKALHRGRHAECSANLQE